MTCPYCGKEMRSGRIPADRYPVMWIPEGGRRPFSSFGRPKGGVVLSDVPFGMREGADSYYCEPCGIVVTPVPQDLNKDIK